MTNNDAPLCESDGRALAFRQSFVSGFLRCPARMGFVLTHGPHAPGIAAVTGQGAHKAFEAGCTDRMESRDSETERLVATAEDHLDRCLRGDVMLVGDEPADREIGKARDGLVRTVRRFAGDVLPTLAPERVEWRIQVEVDPDLSVSTALDLVQAGGVVEDFKTGRKVDDAAARESRQLTCQAMAYRLATGRMPAQLGLRRVNPEGTSSHWTTRTVADMNAYLGIVRQVASCVRAGLFPPCGEGAWWCSPKWCGFHGGNGGPCPHGR